MMRYIILVFLMVCFAPAPVAHATPDKMRPDKILDVQEITSNGGIRAWLVHDKTVPVISVSFSFEGGLALDPDNKPGVARLVSLLLNEGAGDLRAQDFQKEIDDHAIGLHFTPGRDAFYGRLSTLRQHREKAFDLLALALTSPRFDNDAIQRMKNANAARIKSDMGDPAFLVARSFNGVVFEGHHYAQPGAGNLYSMQTIRRDDLVQFAKAQFGRDVLQVAIAGDISAGEAGQMLDRLFGDLPQKADIPQLPVAPPPPENKTVLLQLDTPQTYIAIGGVGIERKDPDFYTALVMNYILGGGGFDARLMHEIREKRGLTYGIHSSLGHMKYATLFQVGLSTANDKVQEALNLIQQQFSLMRAKGVTADEIANAQSYLNGSLLLELTSTGDIADTLNALQRDGETRDYINNRHRLINAVTAPDVKRVAERLLVPEKMTTVLVGKPQHVKTDILLDRPPLMREPRGE